MNKNKQCQSCEVLKGRIAELIPLSDQSKQWKNEYLIATKENTRLKRENEEMLTALSSIEATIRLVICQNGAHGLGGHMDDINTLLSRIIYERETKVGK